jgi:hypothetical protein
MTIFCEDLHEIVFFGRYFRNLLKNSEKIFPRMRSAKILTGEFISLSNFGLFLENGRFRNK